MDKKAFLDSEMVNRYPLPIWSDEKIVMDQIQRRT